MAFMAHRLNISPVAVGKLVTRGIESTIKGEELYLA
jgi:hypothetical protein